MQACRTAIVAATSLIMGWSNSARADDYERAPIRYATAPAQNVIARLQQRLDAGLVQLAFDSRFGYLRSVLKELDVPVASQTLVFSKTSLQRQFISPKRPRALYFNDDVYIGFCQQGEVLEIAAVDPNLGAVFYTLDQEAVAKPKFTRHTDHCLQCHGSAATRGVPGHLLRSVYADVEGQALLSMGSFRVDQTTPMAQRWGGWYVTGTHGQQRHLGNLIVKGHRDPETVDNKTGLNVIRLDERCEIDSYLGRHSDLIALMVLEHQAEMHNLLARATMQTRIALHEETELNRELGRPADYRSETTYRRIKSVGDALVKYLFYSREAPLTEKLQGTSNFAAEFARRGPRDPKGRSLRDFDLEKRMFKYPCSYLVHSDAFAAMPAALRSYVHGRMLDVLTGRDYSRDFDHLSDDDRRAVREILMATVPDLAAAWRD